MHVKVFSKFHKMAFLTFCITHPDEATAQRIGAEMVSRRLAACANIFPVKSAYWWEGAMQQDSEWVSVLKTRTGLEEMLEAAITAIHPYETPCILRLEVRANRAYEDWITASTQP
jgi:periplasmic divalent cation tolerance protein